MDHLPWDIQEHTTNFDAIKVSPHLRIFAMFISLHASCMKEIFGSTNLEETSLQVHPLLKNSDILIST
jgi:hypothetical protein